jgi:signal transduction histidine kinase
MARDRYSYEDLIAELAERQQQLAEVIRERDEFAHQLGEAKSALAEEQNAQYGAYRQLVELERVRAFDDVARGIQHDLFNALTPVEGFTDLLLINPERLFDPAQARAYLTGSLSPREWDVLRRFVSPRQRFGRTSRSSKASLTCGVIRETQRMSCWTSRPSRPNSC